MQISHFWAIKKSQISLNKVIQRPLKIPHMHIDKENKKKDCKETFLIHQCVDEAHFGKIAGPAILQEAWKILEKFNEGAKQLKKVILQTMRH